MCGMRAEPAVHSLPAVQIPVDQRRDRVASARRTRLGTWLRVVVRVCITYRRAHGRLPALLRPRSFTEKIQWRKLFELEPCFAVISDKLAARDFVAQRIGAGRQAAVLWAGDDPDAIPFDRLVPPSVLKSTHGAGQTIIVRDAAALDVAAVRSARVAGVLLRVGQLRTGVTTVRFVEPGFAKHHGHIREFDISLLGWI